MAHYRAYLLDTADHIVAGVDVDAADDDAAWAHGRSALEQHPSPYLKFLTGIELWSGVRCLGRR